MESTNLYCKISQSMCTTAPPPAAAAEAGEGLEVSAAPREEGEGEI